MTSLSTTHVSSRLTAGRPFGIDLSLDAWRNRVIALAILIPCVIVLAIAAWLHPNPAGLGTHEQLGLPPCGFLIATGLPCATCGMTTAFAHAAHGQILAAFITQPAGMVLCFMTTIAAIVSLYALIAGISLLPLGRILWRRSVVIGFFVMILGSWAYTISIHLGH